MCDFLHFYLLICVFFICDVRQLVRHRAIIRCFVAGVNEQWSGDSLSRSLLYSYQQREQDCTRPQTVIYYQSHQVHSKVC